MATLDEIRQSARDLGLDFTNEQLERLATGEEVEWTPQAEALADDCCPEGYIGIGHKPRFCIKPEWPPKLSICWG